MEASNYNTDFYAWCMQQAKFLENGEYAKLDLQNLKEEIESMGKKDFREAKSRLAVLICHLLKWQFQPERQGSSWENTINEQRDEIMSVLKDSPSLNVKVKENFLEIWLAGVKKAVKDTKLSKDIFPSEPIWTLKEILDDDFYPNNDLDNEETLLDKISKIKRQK